MSSTTHIKHEPVSGEISSSESSDKMNNFNSSEIDILDAEIAELEAELLLVREKIEEVKRVRQKYKKIDIEKFEQADFEYVKLARRKQNIIGKIIYRKGKKVSPNKRKTSKYTPEKRVKVIAEFKEKIKDLNKKIKTSRKEHKAHPEDSKVDNELCKLLTERSLITNRISYHRVKLKK